MNSANAETIFNSILETLLLYELNIDNLIAQGYDKAEVMSGVNNGVQKTISEKFGGNIFYVHCYNHQLYLVVLNVISSNPQVCQTFTISEQL